MSQTVLSVVFEVAPESTGKLLEIISDLKSELTWLPGDTEVYASIKRDIPTLHFMSMSVFQDGHYDPLFVIEASFDGPTGPFWTRFEAKFGKWLRPILRCCKRPADSSGPLYDTVAGPDARAPLAPYLERRTLRPSVFHQGNRGMDRQRVFDEAKLFELTQKELDRPHNAPNPYRGLDAAAIHQKLRLALSDKVRAEGLSLDPLPPRISLRERAVDIARLALFAIAVLFVLAVPGLGFLVYLRAFFPDYASTPFLWMLTIPVLVGLLLYWKGGARPGEAAPSSTGNLLPSTKNEFTSLANPFTLILVVLLALAVLTLAMTALATAAKALLEFRLGIFPSFAKAFASNWWPALIVAGVAVYTIIVFSIPAILAWLRWLELRDSHHDAPPVNQSEMRKMTHREDWIPQNHMGSMVLVKPGVLRMALFRAGHLGLGLLLRVVANSGYLGSMRTIHFAQWAFVNNGSRLMFFSNFDHSWDSYLDDFIEKAHGGLTLAWGSCVGFPATRYLIFDGASHGRQFKQWARRSMAVSRFWFTAYKGLTVNQIERNARIAEGLRKGKLSHKEAIAWAKDL
jgi:hypothetical protein